MKKTILSSLVILACAPLYAFADNGGFGPVQEGYVTTQYGQITYNGNAAPGDYDLSGLVVKVGYDINRYFAVEGRVGGGVKSDSNPYMSGSIPVQLNLDLNYLYGMYGVGTVRLIPQLDLYGVVGYSRAEVSAAAPGVSITSASNGVSYGAGVGWNIDPAVALSVEYMSYMNKSGFEAKAITLGLSNRF